MPDSPGLSPMRVMNPKGRGMDQKGAKEFAYSVFCEQAAEGGFVA